MKTFLKPGTMTAAKKSLGALLLLAGLLTLLRPNIITNSIFWEIFLALLMFSSAFFLLISGRQK